MTLLSALLSFIVDGWFFIILILVALVIVLGTVCLRVPRPAIVVAAVLGGFGALGGLITAIRAKKVVEDCEDDNDDCFSVATYRGVGIFSALLWILTSLVILKIPPIEQEEETNTHTHPEVDLGTMT